jgi:hypothetical protein
LKCFISGRLDALLDEPDEFDDDEDDEDDED